MKPFAMSISMSVYAKSKCHLGLAGKSFFSFFILGMASIKNPSSFYY